MSSEKPDYIYIKNLPLACSISVTSVLLLFYLLAIVETSSETFLPYAKKELSSNYNINILSEDIVIKNDFNLLSSNQATLINSQGYELSLVKSHSVGDNIRWFNFLLSKDGKGFISQRCLVAFSDSTNEYLLENSTFDDCKWGKIYSGFFTANLLKKTEQSDLENRNALLKHRLNKHLNYRARQIYDDKLLVFNIFMLSFTLIIFLSFFLLGKLLDLRELRVIELE